MHLKNKLAQKTTQGFRTQVLEEFLDMMETQLHGTDYATLIHIVHLEDLFEKYQNNQEKLTNAVAQYCSSNGIHNHNELLYQWKVTLVSQDQFPYDAHNEYKVSAFESPEERKRNRTSETYNNFHLYALCKAANWGKNDIQNFFTYLQEV